MRRPVGKVSCSPPGLPHSCPLLSWNTQPHTPPTSLQFSMWPPSNPPLEATTCPDCVGPCTQLPSYLFRHLLHSLDLILHSRLHSCVHLFSHSLPYPFTHSPYSSFNQGSFLCPLCSQQGHIGSFQSGEEEKPSH